MKGSPAVPGGPSKSKPTRFSTFGCPTASAFLFQAVRKGCHRMESWFTDRRTHMNKNWLGIIGAIIVVALLVWLLGTKISCHESFWNKDKQVIEVNR